MLRTGSTRELCSKHGIRKISDEVYAMSASPNGGPPPALHSAENRLITRCLLHVLYGTSKDFSSNDRGLAFYLHGKPAIARSNARHLEVVWSSSLAELAWSNILSDESFLQECLLNHTARLTKSYIFAHRYCAGCMYHVCLQKLDISYGSTSLVSYNERRWTSSATLRCRRVAHH